MTENHSCSNEKSLLTGSESDTDSVSSKSRSTKVQTYVISIPKGGKKPMTRYGTIKQINIDHQLKEIEDLIHEVENKTIQLVTNNNDIEVNCSKCCVGMNFSFFKRFKGIKFNIFSRNKVKASASVNVKTGDLKTSVI